MQIVLAVVQEKGGVGKTTTTNALARCLADMGHKVLVLDGDSQGNATSNILPDHREILAKGKTLYEVVKKTIDPSEAIYPTPEGFDIIPSTDSLAALNDELAPLPSRERVLGKIIRGSKTLQGYDYILIDSLAAVGTWFFNILAAARYTITPITPEINAVEGLENLKETIDAIQEDINPDLKMGAVFVNQLTDGQIVDKMILETLVQRKSQGLPLMDTQIHKAAVVRQAELCGKTVIEYAPKHRVSDEFRALALEITQRLT